MIFKENPTPQLKGLKSKPSGIIAIQTLHSIQSIHSCMVVQHCYNFHLAMHLFSPVKIEWNINCAGNMDIYITDTCHEIKKTTTYFSHMCFRKS